MIATEIVVILSYFWFFGFRSFHNETNHLTMKQKSTSKKSLTLLLILLFLVPFLTHAQFAEHLGTGDDIIILEKPNPNLPALLLISGNKALAHFAVKGFDENRNSTGLLVNTTSYYSGIVPIDLPTGKTKTKFLQISAEGAWIIDVFSIAAAISINLNENFQGEGDNVLWIEGEATIAEIVGNQTNDHFAIVAYSRSGQSNGLMVNTTSRYAGKVFVPKNTMLLKITAVGPWSVKLN